MIKAMLVISVNAQVKRDSFICAGSVVNDNSVVGEFTQVDCNAVVACGNIVPEKFKVYSYVEFGTIIKANW